MDENEVESFQNSEISRGKSLSICCLQSDLYIVTPHIVTSYKIPLYNHTFEKTNLYKDYIKKPLYSHNSYIVTFLDFFTM